MKKNKNDFRADIIDTLKEKGDWNETDMFLVDELVFNLELIQKIKNELLTQGVMVNTVRNPDKEPYYQKNPSFSIYDTTLKNIQSLFNRLALTPNDRQRLKINKITGIKSPEDREFSDLFN